MKELAIASAILLCLVEIVACYSATGLRIENEVPAGRIVTEQRVVLRACSRETAESVTFPDFERLKGILEEQCPGAVGMADVTVHLMLGGKKKSGKSPPPSFNCWTMTGYPVYENPDHSDCRVSDELFRAPEPR
ncbi:MAG: hypothetical protein KDK25_03835 [Leptospiraceae bacterium]|nr:hypothetical protein [Leptospiraceae bacterium]